MVGGDASRAVAWRELDENGRLAGTLTQLEARVDTRWLWWATAIFQWLRSLSGDREYMLMSALSIAGAYNLDLALPQRLGEAFGGRLGPSPIMALLTLLVVAGAVVAAALPLVEFTLLLYNPQTRVEVQLTASAGYTRDPSPFRDRSLPWVRVCSGSFETLPPDLRALRRQRAHHAVFLASVVAMGAAAFSRRAAEAAHGEHEVH